MGTRFGDNTLGAQGEIGIQLQPVMLMGQAENSSQPTTPVIGGSGDYGYRYSPLPACNSCRGPQARTGGFGPTICLT